MYDLFCFVSLGVSPSLPRVALRLPLAGAILFDIVPGRMNASVQPGPIPGREAVPKSKQGNKVEDAARCERMNGPVSFYSRKMNGPRWWSHTHPPPLRAGQAQIAECTPRIDDSQRDTKHKNREEEKNKKQKGDNRTTLLLYLLAAGSDHHMWWWTGIRPLYYHHPRRRGQVITNEGIHNRNIDVTHQRRAVTTSVFAGPSVLPAACQ